MNIISSLELVINEDEVYSLFGNSEPTFSTSPIDGFSFNNSGIRIHDSFHVGWRFINSNCIGLNINEIYYKYKTCAGGVSKLGDLLYDEFYEKYLKDTYGCLKNNTNILVRRITESDLILKDYIEDVHIVDEDEQKELGKETIKQSSIGSPFSQVNDYNGKAKAWWYKPQTDINKGVVATATFREIYNSYLFRKGRTYVYNNRIYMQVDDVLYVIQFNEKFNVYTTKCVMLGDKHFQKIPESPFCHAGYRFV